MGLYSLGPRMADTKLQGEVSLDTSNADAAFARVGNNAAKMARTVKKEAADAGTAVDSIGDGAKRAADSFTREESRMRESIRRSTLELQTFGKTMAEKFEAKLDFKGLDVGKFQPYIDELKKAETAAQAAAGSFGVMGKSAKATEAALRQVPAQFTDIVVSLQSGQKPMTVLLQQGGQLKDVFGGVGNAAKAMGGYVIGLVSPYTAAAAAAGVLALAYSQGSKEADAYRRAIVLTGNASGTTVDQLSDMARAISTVSGTQGSAAAALAQMAGSGRVASENLKDFTEVALGLDKYVGIPVKNTVADLVELGKAPLDASIKLNDQYQYLTVSTYAQIKALQEQGRTEDAAALAQRTYITEFEKRKDSIVENLGLIESAWKKVGDVASLSWDLMLGVGRKTTKTQELDSLTAQRDALIKASAAGAGRAMFLTGNADTAGLSSDGLDLDEINAHIEALKGVAAAEKAVAQAQAKAAEQSLQIQQWDKEGDQFKQKAAKRQEEMQKAEIEGRALVNAGIIKESDLTARLADIRAKYKDAPVKGQAEEQNAYENLIATIKAKIAEDQAQLQNTAKLTESQRLSIKLDADLASGKLKLTATHQAEIRASLADLDVQERKIKAAAAEREFDAQRLQMADELNAANLAESKAREAGSVAISNYVRGIDESNDSLQYELSLMGLSEQARNVALEQYRIELDLKKQIAAVNANSGFDQNDRDFEISRLQAAAAIAKANATSKVFLDDWKRSVQKYDDIFRQGFADMLNNGKSGWKSFTQSLVTTFKTTVADAIYKMFAQPFVISMVGSLIGLTGGLSGAASTVAGVTQGGSSMLTMASLGKDIYSAIEGGFSTLSGQVATYVQSGFNWLSNSGGMVSQGPVQVGGLASGLGTVAGYGAGIMGGVYGGRLISGGYSAFGSSGNAAVNIGTVAGTILGGPIGSLLGGAIGGVVNRLFGRKLKDSGIEGEFGGDTGFEGQTYQYYKGGLFRSNKTKHGDLDEDVRSALADQFNSMRDGTRTMAEILGLGTDAIDSFAASIKVSLKGLTDDEIQAKLQEEFDKIAESLASATLGTTEYTHAGETAVEAITRLSSSLVAVNGVFANLNTTLYDSSLAGADMASSLIDLFGDAATFNTKTGSFFQNFYSKDEQRDAMKRQLQAQFDTLGLTLPDIDSTDAREQFRKLAEAQDLTTEAGRKTWASLIQLSDAFASVTNSADDASNATAAQSMVLEDARSTALRNLQDAMDRQTEIWQGQLDAIDVSRTHLDTLRSTQQEALDLIGGVFDLVRDNARDLYGQIDSAAAMQAAQARLFIQQSLNAAQKTGYLPDQNQLSEAISAARGSLTADNYGSQLDMDISKLVLAGQLAGLEQIAGRQKTAAEQQIDLLDRQLQSLDDQTAAINDLIKQQRKTLDYWEKQIAIASGTYDATLSVTAAIGALNVLLGGNINGDSPDGSAATTAVFGGTSGTNATPASAEPAKYYRPVSMGTAGVAYDPITDQSAIDRLDALAPLYHTYDGTGDLTGLLDAMKNAGATMADLSALSGNYESDWRKAAASVGIPAFAVGTNYVPQDMLAQIHKGEAIVPQAFNPWAGSGTGIGSSTARLEALISQLVDDNRRQAGEIVRLNARIAKVLEKWDGDGMPADLEETMA